MSFEGPEPVHPLESFECAPGLRLEAHERLVNLQFQGLAARLDKIEQALERMERRLWLAVFGVAGAMLAELFLPLVTRLN